MCNYIDIYIYSIECTVDHKSIFFVISDIIIHVSTCLAIIRNSNHKIL